ncbi:uncharacterized protein [Euphorbia lathyris]|uniref:uncharacterized protein n=1 Tax=Euphorbia lathyris TaxID=212925 RepID=UPI003313AD78
MGNFATILQAPYYYQRKKIPVKKPHMAGFGVYVNEKTGYSHQQVGNLGGIVISTSAKVIKDYAHVTGDIGFTPTTLKWKGKAAMTPQQLKNQKSSFRPVRACTAAMNTQVSSTSGPAMNASQQAPSTQPRYASSTASTDARAVTTSKSQPNVTKWF